MSFFSPTSDASPAAASMPADAESSSHCPPQKRPGIVGRVFAWLILALLVYVLSIVVEGMLIHLPADTAGTPQPGERIGVVHIHTVASDGSGTIPEVVAAGHQADLSFLAITDHNVSMKASDVANVSPDFAIVSGEELTTSSGHYLALGIPFGWKRPVTPDADTLMAATHAIGAFNVIAHPFHTNIPWTHWNTNDFEGMEIWNEDEVWRRDQAIDLLDAIILYGVNDQLAMVRLARTPERNFAKWDELLAQHPVVGMCGADAHARVRITRTRFLRFPGYMPVFLVAREHVLLDPTIDGGNPATAGPTEILDALRHGHSFCALDALYPAGGYVARVSTGGAAGGPGDFLTWKDSGNIHIVVPPGASQPLIKVFRNGQVIISKQAWTLDEQLPGPGRYRTEVFLRQPGLTGWRRWALWIFSNPTYVTTPGDGYPVPSPKP